VDQYRELRSAGLMPRDRRWPVGLLPVVEIDPGWDCVDAATGELLWRRDSQVPNMNYEPLAFTPEYAFVLEDLSEQYYRPNPPPDERHVCRVTCLAAATGQPRWSQTLPYSPWLFTLEDQLIGLTDNYDRSPGTPPDQVWAIDSKSGELLWAVDLPPWFFITGTPAVDHETGLLAVASGLSTSSAAKNAFIWIDCREGAIVAQSEIEQDAELVWEDNVAVSPPRIYLASEAAGLRAFEYTLQPAEAPQ